MKTAIYNKESRGHVLITAFGIIMLALLILVSLTGAGPFADIPNSCSNNTYNLNKSDEAIKSYEKTIKINPKDSKAWNNKGLALYNLNKSNEAIKAFDKAIEINSQDSDAWYNKGITLAKLGKFDEAIKAYVKATEINPQLRSLVQ
jgi:tetratricopeptide (TPR) repeat protein